MKNALLSIFLLALMVTARAQTTATDFNVKDCAGTDRHLFADLDAGKIVVMSMVHPCISCVNPTKTAIDVVNGFATSHPGRVIFYLTDDDGGTACSSLNSWAAQYSISGVPVISNAAVNQLSYGSTGMPKIVVLGGADHKIYLNQNNGITSSALTTAIQDALNATGLEAIQAPALGIYPNPAHDALTLDFSSCAFSLASVKIYAVSGAVALTQEIDLTLASRRVSLNIQSMAPGIYVLMLEVNGMQYPYKFSVEP